MAEYIQWLRSLVGPALLPIVFATAVVRDAAGRILFQRRADFGAAWWALPGGALETGELLAHTARRQTRDQTGLEVVAQALLGVFAGEEVVGSKGNHPYPVATLFACQASGGSLRTRSAEGQAAKAANFGRDQLTVLRDSEQLLARAALAAAASLGPAGSL